MNPFKHEASPRDPVVNDHCSAADRSLLRRTQRALGGSLRFLTTGRILGIALLLLCVPFVSSEPARSDALSFDGSSSLVMVASNPLLELTEGTLELWFRPDWEPGSIGYNPVLIANSQGPFLTRYSLQLNLALDGVTLANGDASSSVSYNFLRGQWYHLALSGGGDNAQVYVNGHRIGQIEVGVGTFIGLPFYLGSDGVGGFFRGQLDEVRIWSVRRNEVSIFSSASRALSGMEPGLVAYWRLNEGAGSVAIDSTAHGLDGSLTAASWVPSGVVPANTAESFGTALGLVSSRSTCVQVPPSPSLNLSKQFTLESWINPHTAQCSTILSQGDGADLSKTDFILQFGTDGTNCGVAKVGLMTAGVWATSASSIPLDSWTHVAVTFDGTNTDFYINGLLDASSPGSGITYQSGSPLFIGRLGSFCNCSFFEGSLDEVRVWNAARPAPDIQASFRQSIGTSSNLVGYWRFEEQAGIRAWDSSGRGNHGTLMNRPLRLPSFWTPTLRLGGANAVTQECHSAFQDPGATVSGRLIGLAVGDYHALGLKPDGTAIGWGAGTTATGFPELGQSIIPVGLAGVVALAAASTHSIALISDGTVSCWGDNSYGELVPPSGLSHVVRIAAGNSFSLALKADGTVIGWGSAELGGITPPVNATNVVEISAGAGFSLALKSDRTVIGWGAGGPGATGQSHYGQTIIPSGATNVISIAAGSQHALALRADGTVLGWGRNDFGEVNVPSSARGAIALAGGANHSLALLPNGSIVAWGRNEYGQTTIPSGVTNIVAIAAQLVASFALRADGVLFAWGRSDYGALTIPPGLSVVNLPVTKRGEVNTDDQGVNVISYSVTNASGAFSDTARTVIVLDRTPPIITLSGPNPLNLDGGVPFVDPGAAALDTCNGDLTSEILRNGEVNAGVPGVYTLTYTVSDSTGNNVSSNRTVVVRNRPAISRTVAYISGTNSTTGLPTAQFVADVNPGGFPTTAFFQYGLSTPYLGRSAAISLSAGYSTSSFLGTSEGLMPGGTYHYRVVASNILGMVFGPDRTISLPSSLPGDINGDGHVDQRELDAVLASYWPTSPLLMMTNAARLEEGQFQFALTNTTGWAFSVIASSNPAAPLSTWTNIGFAWPVWQFQDPYSSNQPQRFYRLRWP